VIAHCNILTSKSNNLEAHEMNIKSKTEMLIGENRSTIIADKSDIKIDRFKCNRCEEMFSNKDSLKHHIAKVHAKSLECTECGQSFDTSYKLEYHLMEHCVEKEFKCNQCGSEFFLKWRFERHIKGHDETDRKFCHYYNNGKVCPFEVVGCKFKHEISDSCYFKTSCKIYLCQFNHKVSETMQQVDNEEIDKESEDLTDATIETDRLRKDLETALGNINSLENDIKQKEESLGKAEAKIDNLVQNKVTIEGKLKLYSASLRKFIKEKEEK
jgi:DNA-directed RNA polymerase subunit RPC12/RpoP